jgi:hypothetical protein
VSEHSGAYTAAGPDKVRKALEDAIIQPDRTINLATAAAAPALTALRPVLEALRREGGFPLSGAGQPQLIDGTVTLTASGSFGLPGAAPANTVSVFVTLTYTAPDGVDRFALKLEVRSDGWTFSTTFPVLPPTQTARTSGVTVPAASFLTGLPLNAVAFTASTATEAGAAARLTLSGSLPMTGVLQPYAERFGAGPLPLAGSCSDRWRCAASASGCAR